MTPVEIKTAAAALAKEIGESARVFITINNDHAWEKAISAGVYPNGLGSTVALRVESDDWTELFDELRAKWAERAAEYHRKTVRKMALEIIRITAEQGECTDAALRGEEFQAKDVARFGAEACADANAIASNGPFSITPAAKANAA